MIHWAEQRFTANDLLLDRQIVDSRGEMAGRVDDLELSDIADPRSPADVPQGPPVLTALLCGSTAYGPRIGGRLGTWWLAIGRRLRPVMDSYPNRVPLDLVASVDRFEVRLATPRDQLGSYRFRAWVADNIISRIPGNRP
jgi:hypothetical protein